ncbi:MAG: flagellar hook-basal body protein [Opitutaceae bacterium]|nr:flagellar hook-basal body protein [Opitutaceae bacterium]
MNVGLYQSAASLSALERWQDAVAQNITSGEVTAYKKRATYFASVQSGALQSRSGTNAGDNDSQPSIFPVALTAISFRQGETRPTGNDLDIAIQGDGFFEVKMPDGTRAYTRNGEFQTRADRIVVTTQGHELLTEAGTPLQVMPGLGKIVINSDGTVVQGDTPLGRLSIQRFAYPELLTPLSGGLYVSGAGMAPVPVTKPELMQGYLEESNSTPLHEMADLVTVSRAYEANQKLITSRDELLEKVLQALG